jgi:type I restriction enzyme, S subunit
MGSEWRELSLEEIAEVIDSRHKTPTYSESGLPMVRVVDIKGGVLDLRETKRVSEEIYQDFSRGRDPKVGDLVISRVGSFGNISYISSNDRFCLGQNTAFIIPKENSRFLYYQLISPEVQRQIEQMAVGAVQKTISLKSIKQLCIGIPARDKQDGIADILGALDDKIALNHQINTTLESMAQALFKSWFVDFDPVIDNALAAGNPIPEALQARADARAALGDQRKPLPDQIRQQFPDRFVLTEEMGWVPEGWKVTPLSEAIEINPKVTIKKGQKAKHVDMKALPTSGYCVGEISEKEYAGGAKFERGDVLLARITPCLENGKTGVVNFLSDGEPGFGSTEFIVMRPKNAIGTSFVAALARQEAFRQHCISNMVGSSGRQRVQNSCFDTYFICTPKVPDILDLYRDNCEAWFVKMTTLANESRSLGLLRDTLLPKLLSGELRIPEAEKQVEEII